MDQDFVNYDDADKGMLADIIRSLEEAVDGANLLAAELALRSFEKDSLVEEFHSRFSALSQMADRSARATDEIERLVRRLKAA